MSANYSAAVTIARVSSKRQEDEGYSLPAQKRLLKSYAIDRQLNPIKNFEIAESASKSVQRRIFRDAMKFIEDNNIKHLIVEKVDRHVRNLHDAVDTHDWLMADEERRIHFVKDSLVMHKNSRSQEWLNWGIRVVMAKNYIDNLREEAMKGWAEKLAQGWLPASPPPGYMTITKDGKRIHVPDPTTKSLVQQMFKLYLEPSQSVETVTKEMERVGLRTSKGRPYVKSKVHKMLENPFYIGINHFNGKDTPGVQKLFLDKALFEQVQRKLNRKRPPRYRQHNPVLKNLIKCGNCGGLVTWQLQKSHYYGTCQRKSDACKGRKLLREDKIEELITHMLKDLVSPSPEVIDWVIDAMNNRHKSDVENNEHLAASIQTQIDRLTRMDTNLYDDKLAGDISIERYETKHGEIRAQITELETKLNGIDQTLGERLQQRLVLLELTQKAAELYPKKMPEQKRLIITKLFQKLTYDHGVLSVTYTNFARAIAQNVQLTHQIIGG